MPPTAAPRPLHHLQAFTVNWGLLLVLWISAAEPALIWCDERQRGSRGRVQKKHKPALCTRFGSLVKLQTRGAKISLCIKSSDELHKEKNFKEKTAKFKTGRAFFFFKSLLFILFGWIAELGQKQTSPHMSMHTMPRKYFGHFMHFSKSMLMFF